MAEQTIKDYFGILGVEKDSTTKEIQKAYRNLAKTKHPDVSDNPDAKEEFEAIKEAYEVLSDPEKRKEYEEFISRQQTAIPDFEELYKRIHNNVDGVYAPIRGEDLEIKVPFTIEDIKQGKEIEINFDRFVNCADCEGHGFIRKESHICPSCKSQGYVLELVETPFGVIKAERVCTNCHGKGHQNIVDCKACQGKGNLNKSIALKYILPKGTIDGKKVVLTGRGDEGLNGGAKGDLHLMLKHNLEDDYEIKNTFDLYRTIKIPLLLALEGGQVTLNGPKGKKIIVDVPKNLDPDKFQTVIPDEGLLNERSGFNGTLTIRFEVDMLRDLSEETARRMVEVLKG